MSHSNFTTTTIKSHSPIYSHDTVHEATLKYFDGDTLATDVWINKYCLKTPEGALLEKTPDDLHKRLAREFSRIENNYLDPVSYDEIYTVLKDFRYIIPQGSPMAGIGNNNQTVSIANCFVIGNDADSYSGILSLPTGRSVDYRVLRKAMYPNCCNLIVQSSRINARSSNYESRSDS